MDREDRNPKGRGRERSDRDIRHGRGKKGRKDEMWRIILTKTNS